MTRTPSIIPDDSRMPFSNLDAPSADLPERNARAAGAAVDVWPAARLILGGNALLIAVAIGLGLGKTGNPSRYFGEGRFTTGASCFELLTVAAVAARVFSLRLRGGAPLWRAALIWLLVAFGFVFLAADEGFQFHERMDKAVHRILSLSKTELSERIDDGIIALYAVIGLGAFWAYRRELLTFRGILPWLSAGFVCTGVSIGCDTLANGADALLWLLRDPVLAERAEGWVAAVEGAAMLLAEGFFVIAFLHAARTAARLPNRNEPAPPVF